MVAMHMVQVTVMDMVHVVPVTDHQVPIIVAVHMVGMGGCLHWRFAVWIHFADLNHMLIDMITMDEM